MMQKISLFLNPISRLGSMKYSAGLPFAITIIAAIALEIIAYNLLSSPDDIGFLAIYIFISLIIYFAFRDGIKGGTIVTGITISYYVYIIYTRNYQGDQFVSGIRTTLMLSTIYLLLAAIIGGLKQKIDVLIETEADGRRRLRAIIEQLPVGVVVSDRYGKITQVNAKAQEIIGKKVPMGFVLGSQPLFNARKSSEPASRKTVMPLFDMLSLKQPVVNEEFIVDRDQGSPIYVQISFNNVENEKNKVIASAFIINDITAQIELEQRKDDFINMASHELKTPLTSLKLFNDFLLRTLTHGDNDPAMKILNRIRSQIDKLQRIVDELLDVSKIKTGKLVLNKEKFDLNELIQEVIDMYQNPQHPDRLKYAHTYAVMVVADRFRIYQVLSNLISNALKYSREHQPILISVDTLPNEIRVQVQDFGIGIENDQHEQIFSRLYQVAAHKKQGIQGFGMGLYICKEIIERHEGRIWVSSESEVGSTFIFTLPYSDETIEQDKS